MANDPNSRTSVPLLPRIASGANIQRADRTGAWNAQADYSILDNLARSLDINREEVNRRPVVSIPDVWAQVVEFEHGLSVNRRSRVDEWRGLFAIWALSGVRGYRIGFERCEFVRMQEVDERIEVNDIASFSSVANSLRPKTTIAGNVTWSEIGVMLLDGLPIGLVVPSTILAPARNAEETLLKNNIWWSENGKLTDPLKSNKLSERELKTLLHSTSWMLEAFKRYEQEIPHDLLRVHQVKIVKGLFEGFQTNIKEALEGNSEELEFTEDVRNFNLPVGKPFIFFNRSFSAPRQEHFAACLYPREEFENDFKGAILAFPNLPDVIGKHPEYIHIWDIATLEDINSDKAVLGRIRDDAADSGFLMLEPHDFFTEYLCDISATGNIKNHGHGADGYVLPLNPCISLFMDPTAIKRYVRFETHSSDGPVTVSITLHARSSKNEDIAISIKQTYPRNKIVKAKTPDVLAMWPNFRVDWWGYNYTYASATDPDDLRFACPFETTTALKCLRTGNARSQRLQNALAIGSKLASFINTRSIKQGSTPDERSMMFLTDKPAETMICRVEVKEKAGRGVEAGEHDVTRDAGILLMPELAPAKSHGDAWTVSIDFGTTNTAIYHQIGGGASHIAPLNFADRTVSAFTGDMTKGDSFISMSEDFVPPMQPPMPFQTILAWSPDVAIDDRRPIQSDRISFHNDDIGSLSHMITMLRLDDGSVHLKKNLKWNMSQEAISDIKTSSDQRADIRLFLAHVILSAMAEASSKGATPDEMTWLFSYPEAFLQSDLAGFKLACSEAVKNAVSPHASEQNKFKPKLSFETESISSAFYFEAQEKAFFNKTVITIDMGGGTSDISIWQGNKLKWQGSARLAGRDIFINYLKKCKPLLTTALPTDADTIVKALDALYAARGKDDEVLTAAIETIVNSDMFDQNFRKRLADLSDSDELNSLRTQAEFALSGLLYYAGQVCAALAEKGDFDLGIDSIRICLGGRGSKLFNSLFGSHDDETQARFAKLFQDASGHTYAPQPIFFSQDPKLEVAHGIIAKAKRKNESGLDTDGSFTDPVIGLAISADGTTHGPLTTYLQIAEAEKWELADLDNIQAFTKAYSKTFQRKTPFAEEFLFEVRDRLSKHLNTIHDSAKQASELQKDTGSPGGSSIGSPLFVLAVSESIRLMNETGNYIKQVK